MNDKNNIILVGFMASGKSRIGQALAKNLGYTLIDLDQFIEQQENKSIKAIFSTRGEAYFRDLEYKTLSALKNIQNTILVTGGGTPSHFASAQILKTLGDIYFLDASFERCSERLLRSSKRPLGLFDSPEQQARVRELFYYRRPLYLALGHRIDVNHEDHNRTVHEIIGRHDNMTRLKAINKLHVPDAYKPYDIYLGERILGHLEQIISIKGFSNYKLVVVTSEYLAKLRQADLELVADSLVMTIKDGEEHKNWSSIQQIHDYLFHHNCTRQTLIIALGGGTVGDVAAFAASIYMRGLPVIQIPTSLLAMVDSSVGGKTGIDTPQGKNLIGSFHMPSAVLIDTGFLSTLPPQEYACGMAEIIKHALIADPELFYQLLAGPQNITEIIKRALHVKINLVASDPFESHVRAHLNLGHTFAHAIEKVSGYRIKHGEAVAIGLVLATKLAQRVGILEQDFLADLIKLLRIYDLPTEISNLDRDALISAMRHDKKKDSSGLRFILPRKLASITIQTVAENDIQFI
jgi:3-dehydroquinate synthase